MEFALFSFGGEDVDFSPYWSSGSRASNRRIPAKEAWRCIDRSNALILLSRFSLTML
jgi:hypothetical protein